MWMTTLFSKTPSLSQRSALEWIVIVHALMRQAYDYWRDVEEYRSEISTPNE